MAFCSQCGASLASGASFCASCGRSVSASGEGSAATTVTTMAPVTPATHVHVHVGSPASEGKPISQGVAITALVLNIIIWPGLGSLIAGEQIGWAQGFLMLLGLILTVTLIGAIVGVPLMIGMWIWAIVTGVQLIARAGEQARARPA